MQKYRKRLIFIYDGKVADVAHVNEVVAKRVYEVGFDLIIVHGMVGYEGGVEGVVNVARSIGKGILSKAKTIRLFFSIIFSLTVFTQ